MSARGHPFVQNLGLRDFCQELPAHKSCRRQLNRPCYLRGQRVLFSPIKPRNTIQTFEMRVSQGSLSLTQSLSLSPSSIENKLTQFLFSRSLFLSLAHSMCAHRFTPLKRRGPIFLALPFIRIAAVFEWISILDTFMCRGDLIHGSRRTSSSSSHSPFCRDEFQFLETGVHTHVLFSEVNSMKHSQLKA